MKILTFFRNFIINKNFFFKIYFLDISDTFKSLLQKKKKTVSVIESATQHTGDGRSMDITTLTPNFNKKKRKKK